MSTQEKLFQFPIACVPFLKHWYKSAL